MDNIMNPFEKIPEGEIQFFKEKVQRWINVDHQIVELEKQIKELKKVRNKELEPQITTFMKNNNVTDLNTDNGILRCKEKKVKKNLNKDVIRENLSKYLNEEEKLDSAMQDLWVNRGYTITHKLQKVTK
tara:strand:+ start:2670 stop:3056 length:387 start_codon:yes stop_codon:yes gene_type:complete